jgi:hypothetical protein
VNWSALACIIIVQPGVTAGTVVDASGIASSDACEGLLHAAITSTRSLFTAASRSPICST